MIQISNERFLELIRKGISLDLVYILTKYENREDPKGFQEPKIENLITTLERKGYIESDNITLKGRELLESVKDSGGTLKLSKISKKPAEWKDFLKAYPPNNKFTWKGRTFDGGRSIRKDTKDGEMLFYKILSEGNITSEMLTKCVIAEAINKFDASVKSGQNKMDYFTNTESWLRQKQYWNWEEEAKVLTDKEIATYYEAFNRKKKTTGDIFI